MSKAIPSQARVVIVGGGVVGASIAYHLTKLGWSDVALLERKRLTSGTTWHAAGLVGQLRATQNLTKLAKYTTDLYAGLEQETGQATGFMQRGSISIATHGERFEELKRSASMAKIFGVEVHDVTPSEIRQKWPLLNVDDVVGGVWLPNDGQINPIDVTMAMIKGATMRGAKVYENTAVLSIKKKDGRAVGVVTDQGEIDAEFVVLATGMWSRHLGEAAGVAIPLHPCEHFYIVTEAFPGLTSDLPVLRDPDNCAYYKEDAGKLLLGAFEGGAKPWDVEQIPEDFEFGELPEDFDHFSPILEAALKRLPALEKIGIRKFFNGPESFTPDVRYMLGEAPELKHLFVAAGFNSIGIQSAGGAGKVLAEWIIGGHAPMDLWDVDIRRMQPHQTKTSYIKPRAAEALGLLYAMHWPHKQYETSRDVRHSPLHERMKANGACFGEAAGMERPNWFAPAGVEPIYEYSYKRQNWFPYAASEVKAVRETVALFDMTSFAKFRVSGPGAEASLQRICAGDVGGPIGKVTYTQWLNERGGIEADLTVTRLSATDYLVVTAGATGRRDLGWLRDHLTGAEAIEITDDLAVLSVMGPNARSLLGQVSGADLSNAAFPFATSQEIDVAGIRLRASRITYVGELGWELYVPAAGAVAVLDALMAAGPAHGLKLAGMHAMDSCRMEKGYRHWGHDIADEDTPIEAGLMFAVKLEKGVDFIGRAALLAQKGKPLTKRLVHFMLKDPEPLLYHNEPIWRGSELVGRVTSGAYGHSLGAAVALGLVDHAGGVDAAYVAGDFEIEVAGVRVAATASLTPFYDPKSLRVKA